MILLKQILELKLKYVVGVLCCILLVVVLTEKRHFTLMPTFHILNDKNFNHLTVQNSSVSDEFQYSLILASNDGNVAFYQMSSGLINLFQKTLPELSPFKTYKLSERILLTKLIRLYNKELLLVLHEKAILRAYELPQFTIKWQTALFEDSPAPNAELIAGEIIASDVCLKPNFCGFVFIGISLSTPHNHENSQFGSDGDVMDHFSTIALNWHNGSIIWHHRPGDFMSKSNPDSIGLPTSHLERHWKLKLFNTHKQNLHVGEKPWQFHRKEFNQILPHSWTTREDTRLSLLTTNPSAANNLGRNANTLSASYQNGVDLLDLASGRPKARILLPAAKGRTFSFLSFQSSEHLYDIQLSSNLDGQNYPRVLCVGSFTQLDEYDEEKSLPEIDFLCDPVNYFDYPRFALESWTEDMNKSVSPVVINSVGKARGLWGIIFHLLGGNVKNSNLKDIIFLTSEGALTSYSSAGHVNWRVNSQVSWLHLSHFIKEDQLLHDSIHETYTRHFRPSMQAVQFTFGVYTKTDIHAMLVMGWDSFSLVDLSDGHLLATHSLPCHPIRRPFIIGRDIIINCDTMVLSFYVGEAEQWQYLAALAISFTLAFVFLSWLCDPECTITTSF